MISYDPFWNTLKAKKISQYKLITQYGITSSLLSRLKNNQNISTHTINLLCEILDCQVQDILEFKKETVTK